MRPDFVRVARRLLTHVHFLERLQVRAGRFERIAFLWHEDLRGERMDLVREVLRDLDAERRVMKASRDRNLVRAHWPGREHLTR